MDKRKRYQIFVSSTFADLEVERGKVMETILSYDCFPAGMEMFPAMDEEIFQYIKRIIDDSDYYLLIIGGRYGSEDKDGVSWTEKEYEYAVSKGIPVIAFDHKDFTQLKANQTDQDDKKRRKLLAFKKKVATGRLIAKWTNADDLALAVAKSLKSVLDLQPRIGWVRADSILSGDVQKEFERLKKEIADRQAEVNKLTADLKNKDAELTKKDADNQALFQVSENLEKQILFLEAELTKYKISKSKTENKSQPQTEEFTVNGVSFKMVHVEGGSFMMGANEGVLEATDDEKPTHEVSLSDYWMGETQVTQALWHAVMGKNPSSHKGDPNLPVENVSWLDCREFILKLNKLTGKRFRLPTEAQWEFAARGGNLGKQNHYLYSGSNDIYDVAWFDENSKKKTHPVGECDPNELGLYDMSGNVWEWCNDRYDHYYYSNSPSVDPIGPLDGSMRVFRGGSWFHDAGFCRVWFRNYDAPTGTGSDLGLRLAL